MSLTRRHVLSLGAAFGAGAALPTWAQGKPLFDTLNMFVPAAPGGGWDGTARAIERAAKAAGLVGNMPFENVGGAGGMVGLPRYVNQRKGQGNSLMVGGSVMVGAAIANKSPVTMRNVTPIARLTEEAGVVAVPAGGKFKTWKDLEAALKANPKAVPVAGGSAGGTDHLLLGMIIKALGGNARDAAYVAFAVVLASVLGPTAPTVLASPVDPGVLRDVTYYRACAGQARSGTSIERPDRVERDRNLAHVLTLAPAHRDGTEVAVAAPFDGVVTRTVVDEGPGDVGSKAGFRRQGNYVSEVTIVRSGIPLTGSWSATFRRVFPVVAVGDRVRAGDRIGTAPPSDWDEVEFLDGTTAGLANQPVSIDVVLRWACDGHGILMSEAIQPQVFTVARRVLCQRGFQVIHRTKQIAVNAALID